jgi:hypothetical protein
MVKTTDIDILETVLRRKGDLLSTLLSDKTTGKNIIWGTDSYMQGLNKSFAPSTRMEPDLVTGIYGKLIQPRAAKTLDEQRRRTRDKAEVFTPLHVVDQMNKLIDRSEDYHVNKENWQNYVRETKLEIACGEAPFIVSRYNPTAHTGKLKKIVDRVGFLDNKLHVVSRYCNKPKEWLYWATEAYKSSYGYEWQGDNILIARENLLYTLIDYHIDKFGRRPKLAIQQEFAEIISWNIFQMDGLKYVIPLSCSHETKITPGKISFFDGEEPDIVEEYECEGCKFNRPTKHNGKYAKIMDWAVAKPINFVSLATELEKPLER